MVGWHQTGGGRSAGCWGIHARSLQNWGVPTRKQALLRLQRQAGVKPRWGEVQNWPVPLSCRPPTDSSVSPETGRQMCPGASQHPHTEGP